jgi:hypothetical protein
MNRNLERKKNQSGRNSGSAFQPRSSLRGLSGSLYPYEQSRDVRLGGRGAVCLGDWRENIDPEDNVSKLVETLCNFLGLPSEALEQQPELLPPEEPEEQESQEPQEPQEQEPEPEQEPELPPPSGLRIPSSSSSSRFSGGSALSAGGRGSLSGLSGLSQNFSASGRGSRGSRGNLASLSGSPQNFSGGSGFFPGGSGGLSGLQTFSSGSRFPPGSSSLAGLLGSSPNFPGRGTAFGSSNVSGGAGRKTSGRASSQRFSTAGRRRTLASSDVFGPPLRLGESAAGSMPVSNRDYFLGSGALPSAALPSASAPDVESGSEEEPEVEELERPESRTSSQDVSEEDEPTSTLP